MKLTYTNDTPHPFGPITYQFSNAEVQFSDCSRFLQMFDPQHNKDMGLTMRQVGSLVLEIGTANAFQPTAADHPVSKPEFQAFARQLLSSFPALPLLLDFERDKWLPNLVLGSLTSVGIRRDDTKPDRLLFAFENEEYSLTVSGLADAIRQMGREIGLTDPYINAIRVKLWNHLYRDKING